MCLARVRHNPIVLGSSQLSDRVVPVLAEDPYYPNEICKHLGNVNAM